MDHLSLAISGFGTGLGLIVVIGAQNALVLRQGILRRHVGAVSTFCVVADVALILAGVLGVGAVIDRAPTVLDVVRWGGVAFLVAYGLLALRRAVRPGGLTVGTEGAGPGLRTVLATAAALTFLNPHVYLDTVLLLGSIANQHDDGRWAFAAGAGLGSTVWFYGLGFGARWLAPLFARPAAWRVLDGVIAAVMFAVAFSLARH